MEVITSNPPNVDLLVGSAEEESRVLPAGRSLMCSGHRLPGVYRKPLGQGRQPGRPSRHVWPAAGLMALCEQGPGSPSLKPLPLMLSPNPESRAGLWWDLPLCNFMWLPSASAGAHTTPVWARRGARSRRHPVPSPQLWWPGKALLVGKEDLSSFKIDFLKTFKLRHKMYIGMYANPVYSSMNF